MAVSFMERYKFEYKTIDISLPENDVLPYVIIDDTYGFAGFPEVKDEYQVLEYIQRVKK